MTMIRVTVIGLFSACASGDPVESRALALDVELDAEELEFLRLINEYRAGEGLEELTASPTLDAAADGHSHDMVDPGFFDHISPDGRDPADRCCDAGYPYACPLTTAIGENILVGSAFAADAFAGWRSSPGHDANMRDPEYLAIGIGRVEDPDAGGRRERWYWTTDFAGIVDEDALCGCEDGATRDCMNGSCAGVETCAECGWGACDAPSPGEEVCNEADDDCDGETDEGLVCGGDSDSDSDGDTDGDADGWVGDADGDTDGVADAADAEGCGCRTMGDAGHAAVAAFVLAAWLAVRRREDGSR